MSFRSIALAIGLTLSAAAPAIPLLADDDVLNTFVEAKDGARSCWSRAYTAGHLAEHPDQKVTEMYFGMQYMDLPVSEDWPEGFELYNFVLRARERGWNDFAEASGNCFATEDGSISCGVECDGGGVYISHADDGKVLVDLETVGFIRMLSCGAEGDSVHLEAGKDDKTFLLSPLPDDACSEIVLPDPDEGID